MSVEIKKMMWVRQYLDSRRNPTVQQLFRLGTSQIETRTLQLETQSLVNLQPLLHDAKYNFFTLH